MASNAPAGDHAALMDSVYRGQRHIYDLTRKYYLFGRDRLIAGLACQPGDSVLEIACGTGRNLARVRETWPGTVLYGVDISAEMLKSARARLRAEAVLAAGDARDFGAQSTLGQAQFDRVILSYALSMIPGWERALAHAAALVAPGGSLHVVDFGDLTGLPGPLSAGLKAWLAKFHVEPRRDLLSEAAGLATARNLQRSSSRGPLGYYCIERLFARQ